MTFGSPPSITATQLLVVPLSLIHISTLTVSPHKIAPLINAICEKLAEDHGVLWLPSDFKKRDGYRRSIELSHEYGLYRQSWCGCGLPENS